jgi:hypothetical protein
MTWDTVGVWYTLLLFAIVVGGITLGVIWWLVSLI